MNDGDLAAARPADEQIDRLLESVRLPDGSDAHPELLLLVDYRRGRLTAGVDELETHLARCAPCRESLLRLAEPPPDATLRWARAELLRGGRMRVARWGPALALAASALIAMSIWLTPRGTNPDTTQTVESYAYRVDSVTSISEVKGSPSIRADDVAITLAMPVVASVRPRVDVPLDVELRVVVSQEGTVLGTTSSRGDPSLIERSAGGAFRVRAGARELFAAGPGRYQLSFVVLPPGAACTWAPGAPLEGARRACAEVWLWDDVRVEVRP